MLKFPIARSIALSLFRRFNIAHGHEGRLAAGNPPPVVGWIGRIRAHLKRPQPTPEIAGHRTSQASTWMGVSTSTHWPKAPFATGFASELGGYWLHLSVAKCC